MRFLMTGVGALALAACTATPPASNSAATGNSAAATAAAASASASLKTATGADAGTVTATDAPGGLTVAITAMGVPAGVHGVHIHAVGKCDAPTFQTAGPHWNPTAKQHGADNPAGAHSGDLPNLTIAADGTGSLTYTVPGATLAGLRDADGAAFLIHAKADDYRTDPSGNSGDRIACGVFG